MTVKSAHRLAAVAFIVVVGVQGIGLILPVMPRLIGDIGEAVLCENPFRRASPCSVPINSVGVGGQGWIRTSVRLHGQIYSLLPLTTRPPVHTEAFLSTNSSNLARVPQGPRCREAPLWRSTACLAMPLLAGGAHELSSKEQ